MYKDLSIDGRVVVEDKDAILQKLEMLLYSNKNSNFFYREYSCDLRDILFMQLNRISANMLIHRLKSCISRHIPELVINHLDVIPDYENRKHKVLITLSILGSETFTLEKFIEPNIK